MIACSWRSLVAAALHGMLIFGISFDALREQAAVRQVEVTLVQTPGRQVPQDARHIAQADQSGSGSEAQRARPASEASAAATVLPATTERASPRSRAPGNARRHQHRCATACRRSSWRGTGRC
jgi:protein TonB